MGALCHAVKRGGVCIPLIVLSVGQACNFKCRNCGNFAPYSPRELLRYPIEAILHDFDMLFVNCSLIENLQIQGGEPFCYSDLPKLLAYLNRKKRAGRVRQITIATNGSVLPSDDILEKIKEYGVQIRISDYGIVPEQVAGLEQRCKELQIQCSRYDFVSAQGQWYDLGGVGTPREDDDKTVRQRFQQCEFRGCLTLEHGELTYCSRATNSYAIQGFERKAGDFLPLSDGEGSKEALRRFLAKRHFMEACRYCNGTDGNRMIPPAIQM